MGAVSTLLLVGFLSLAFAITSYLDTRKQAPGTADRRAAIAQDMAKRMVKVEIGIAALAWIAAAFLKLKGIDIPAAAWHQMIAIAFAVLALMAGPGAYLYLSWRQRQWTRQRRLPDGSLSEKDAQSLQRLSRFKNLLLLFVAGASLLVFYIR
jgi:hypothetical protein